MARLEDAIQQGTRAAQPLATAVAIGCLYGVTDEGDIIERSDGAAWQNYSPGSGQSVIVQVVNTQSGAVASGTTIIPYDDTIPQKTEGDEYMTRAITPTNATNKLKIDVVIWLSASTARYTTAALFQDTTADALAAMSQFTGSTENSAISFSHYMTAGTTSATTFKVRAGVDTSGTTTFNGQAAGRKLGGVVASSITITEIVP